MLRNILNFTIQNKNFVMFFTSIAYIIGLYAYFSGNLIVPCAILSTIGIWAIVKNFVSWKYVLLWLFLFYFGFFNAQFRISNTDELFNLAPTNASITGQIISIPNSNYADKTKFFLSVREINSEKVDAKTLVTVYDKKGNFSKLNIGDSYTIKGKLRTPFKAGNPSQFDYGRYLKNFGAHTVFYANLEDCQEIHLKLSPRWQFMQTLNNVRKDIIKTHSQYLKSPNLEILGGIVFGDDAVAPPDYVKTTFVNSGLLHILAASGMNVAFIYGFWFFILRKLRFPYKFTVISGILVIILYSLMTGLGPSVIRAAIMLIFILLGKLIDRDAHSVSLLSFVALLMLIYNPAYINDVGFQLSFIVTFGLLTTANAIFERCKMLPNWLSGAIFIPIVAQIWVIPIQMFYFNTISIYSVFANILTVPFLSIISFGGFVSSILATIPPIANQVCSFADMLLNPLLNILVEISTYFSNLPHALLTTSHPHPCQIALYYLIVIILTLIFKLGAKKNLIGTLGLLSLILLLSNQPIIPNRNLEITAFDVQNADSFLIKTPKNKYFIIDTGKSGYNGGKTQAEMIILKYLKDNGIDDIEGLIITHFDNDHSGGAVDILKNVYVRNVYVNTLKSRSKTSKDIYNTLNKYHVRTHLAKNNDIIYIEPDLKIKTYKADFPQVNKYDNENSILTLVSYKDFDMLLMGDAGVKSFYNVKYTLPKHIEVLKVGHHGAKGVVDNDMLKYLCTQIAIISVGPNKFGHPNQVTLDFLKDTKTFRTDRYNSTRIKTNGLKYQIFSYDTSKRKYIYRTANMPTH